MRVAALGVLLLVACDAEPVDELDAVPDERETGSSESEVRGEIVFLEERGPPNFRVATLSLDTGAVETLFTLPSGAFAYEVAPHPLTGDVLLSYTEPAEGDEPGFDRSGLVMLGSDGPQYVLGDDEPGHWAFYPKWSADGASVWYVDVDTNEEPSYDSPLSTLVRVRADTGEVEVEIPWATEPTVSPDGEHMAWVAIQPGTWRREVVLATADGDPIRTLVHADDVYDLGLPTFSADGRGVFISVLEEPAADSSTMGSTTMDPSAMDPSASESSVVTSVRNGPVGHIIPVSNFEIRASLPTVAHGVHLLDADWYGIAIDGIELEPVSALSTIQYEATVSMAEWILVAATREGIDVVDIARGTSERLLSNRAIRSVAWRPS